MACGEPRVCCCCCSRPDDGNDATVNKRDRCMCGCGYLNGPFQIAVAQFLLLVGFFFSLAALGDCSFASIGGFSQLYQQIGGFINQQLNPDDNNKVITAIGFITFEINGQCYWYTNSTTSAADQIQSYFQLLGNDFSTGRAFAALAVVLGFLLFFYSTTFCCSSQVKGARYFMTFLLSVCLTLFQGLSMLVFTTRFCTLNNCQFDRSAGFSVGALLCFFLAGLSFAVTSDYPGGPKPSAASPDTATTAAAAGAAAGGAAVVTEDKEEPALDEEAPAAAAEEGEAEAEAEEGVQEEETPPNEEEQQPDAEAVAEEEEEPTRAAATEEEVVADTPNEEEAGGDVEEGGEVTAEETGGETTPPEKTQPAEGGGEVISPPAEESEGIEVKAPE